MKTVLKINDHRRAGHGGAEPPRGMKLGRFLVPRSVLSLFALMKWGCRVSPRAECEWSATCGSGAA